jgi:hypothetical protein
MSFYGLLTLHPATHSSEEIILNSFFYSELKPNDLIAIYDPEHHEHRLIVRVPNEKPTPSTLEISIQKSIAEAVSLIQYTKVVVERITEADAALDFVELSFKRQYLQRSNMYRFKQSLIGRTLHLNQNITINGMQASVQEVKNKDTIPSDNKRSGLITESTKFVFRSKSARIIWLVQISAEMWDIDPVSQNSCFLDFIICFLSFSVLSLVS